MALRPLRHYGKSRSARADLVARLPVLVAAFLIALFGLLPGTQRITDIAASARPIDDRSDRSPALTKRDPIRAVAVAERKDGTGSHFAHDDGFIPPLLFVLSEHDHVAVQPPSWRDIRGHGGTWPGARPRAPPFAA